ncbi:conserved hypothetical protein [Talaromyces stipitatus ATCC 10500]|uniref:ATP-dependent DNA helicase n=1 Tax=Talaromyces stipitatus (strain ATCC 10500 / CBS 375.48 / QM 6759 / NRRL 1006) TaxID=441959 RepID=B8MT08_TALSN|nr:uncharacterized protein TSTA_001040 [Talaromyces stipitatus ATCC 10500]EED12032.1 conserved hypothetical protein [Talaromyces stipitatus ATCC 10500]
MLAHFILYFAFLSLQEGWLILQPRTYKLSKPLSAALQQIFPTTDTDAVLPFRGLNIVLAGDFYQLPPVGQRPLYYNKRLHTLEEIHGRLLYQTFNTTIQLNKVRRQTETGANARAFLEALQHLWVDELTLQDWEILCTHVQAVVPNKVERFKDAICIYSRKAQVYEFNHNCLRDISAPVLRVPATYQGSRAAQASTNEAGNLHAKIHLSIGCRVMLIEDIWIEHGLVNGAFSMIIDIIWEAGITNPREIPPYALLIHFDTYNGPEYITINEKKVVPIFRSKRDFSTNNINCSRIQFPITVAYAMTIHKAQGITVPKAVLNIAEKDFTISLTYVALSRVKALNGVLFEEPFNYQHFVRKKPHESIVMRQEDAHSRHEQHVFIPSPVQLHFDYIPLPPQLPSQIPRNYFQALLATESSPQRGSSVIPRGSSHTPPNDEIA